MNGKIEDIPGTPLKVVIKNNSFFTFYIEKNKDIYNLYTPLGFYLIKKERKTFKEKGKEDSDGKIISPMSGKIVKVFKKEGDYVNENESLCVIEAMKMQNEIKAKINGKIIKAEAKENKTVKRGEILYIIKGDEK